MPTLTEVTRRTKDEKAEHGVASLTQISKVPPEPKSIEPGPTLQKIEITSSFEIKEDTYKSVIKTEKTQSEQGKKPEEAMKEKQQKETETKVPVTDKSKMLKDEEPKTSGLSFKKGSTMPLTEKGQGTVMLKPVIKPGKSDSPVLKKDKKDDGMKDTAAFQTHERLQMHERVVAMQMKEVTPAIINGAEAITAKPVASAAQDTTSKDPTKPLMKAKDVKADEKGPQAATDKDITGITYPDSTDQKPNIKWKESEKDKKPEKELDKIKKQQEEQKPGAHIPSTVKKTEKSPKEEKESLLFKKHGSIPKQFGEKEEVLLKPVEVDKKPVEHKKTPSPKAEKPTEEKSSSTPARKAEKSPKEEDKQTSFKKTGVLPAKQEEKLEVKLKPVAKKEAEPKKSPSPKTESILMERKPSVKEPKKLSPKDSVESITLKKVPKKISPQDDTSLKPEKTKLPLLKELSPGAVELERIPTQQEEEVFEEEDENEEDEEEEAWGWELAPHESYGSEDSLEDGAVETPGGVGDKRGEREAKTLPLVSAIPHPPKSS